jgi:CRISPR system Cascade subunit CasB
MEQNKLQKTDHHPQLTPFGKWISAKVRLLATGGKTLSGIRQGGYMQNDAHATAAVAKLRQGVGHEIGDDPSLFEWTLPDPDNPTISGYSLNHSAEPTDEERAAYAAITLFAVHQQSIHEASMHTDDNVSLGYAVARLAYDNFNEAGIRSLFDRLQTANSWKESVRHARGLIKLLKRERIALNYGLLAQDLLGLRSGRKERNGVRLRWGRTFQVSWAKQSAAQLKTS